MAIPGAKGTGKTAAGDFAGAVTIGDNVPLMNPTAWLWIGTAGDLTVQLAGTGRDLATFKNVPVGRIDVSCVRVMTATTALNITAVF